MIRKFRLDRPVGILTAVGCIALAACAERSPLERPDESAMSAPAPDSFHVRFETTAGNFTILARRDWAPAGVDRLHYLVNAGFYDNTRFFRVIPGFMAQFGIHGDPRVSTAWRDRRLRDDEVRHSNVRGTVTFASGGPNTRTTQLFINYGNNVNLDAMGFAPIAEVVEGMDVVDALHGGYGEGAPRGQGPDQGRVMAEGNDYLEREFPRLDAIRTARIVDGTSPPG
jgi:peptidyl-prolyl cis-trans isomerase A (cyclophilin A)